MAEYKVKFEVFEGPLDLLLYLIKKEEVDIYEVNLPNWPRNSSNTSKSCALLDLEIAGEFLVMASTLMYIKSRELLPLDQQVLDRGRGRGRRPALGIDPPIGRIQKIQGRRRPIADPWKRARKIFSRACPHGPNSPRKPAAEAGCLAVRSHQCRQCHPQTRRPARGFARRFRGQMDGQRKNRDC